MIEQILVTPYNEELLEKLKQKTLVVKTDDQDKIQLIHRGVSKHNKLHAIQLNSPIALSSITFKKEWKNIPLCVYSSEFGGFKNLIPKLDILNKLNIRIFLSSDLKENFTGIRILSSLGIACGLFFGDRPIDWESLNDLMHHAIYSQTNHAPIEPFSYVASNYDTSEYIDYSFVYFNNATRYLHLNEQEQIALCNEDLINRDFISTGVESIESIIHKQEYEYHINSRYDVMLSMNECAFCPAFRICLGKFSEEDDKQNGCQVFFSDFLDAAEHFYKRKNNTGNKLWQL